MSADDPGPVTRAIAAPAVRRLAREMDIDINQVSGTGPGGRVTAQDLAVYHKADVKEADKTSEKESHKTPGTSSNRMATPFRCQAFRFWCLNRCRILQPRAR